MIVAYKHIYAQNDCFEARERGISVRVGRLSHIVTIEITAKDGTKSYKEATLAQLASVLNQLPELE